MAKKRWLVRETTAKGGWYWVLGGDKPRKPKNGWPADVIRMPLSPELFKQLFAKRYQLKPGGGPVEIEFKHEE